MPLTIDSKIQFTAILGDLQHKTDVYISLQDFGPDVERFFANHSQAEFLRDHFPELVPDQPGSPPSDHHLGTIFEFHYYFDLAFRFRYLQLLKLGLVRV